MIRPTQQIYSDYRAEDFQVWKKLFDRQMSHLEDIVSSSYHDAIDVIEFRNDRIPDFGEVNRILGDTSGWQIEVIPNICPDARFFECCSRKTFTSTCWLRSMEQLDYLEEPDMFHDVFGHMPLLTNRNYADFFSEFGKIALDYIDNPEAIQLLSRVYWFTIEFGLISEGDGQKIYGAGIISSFSETNNALEAGSTKIDFDIATMMNTPYRNDIIQDKYFVIEDYGQLYSSIPEIRTLLAERFPRK